jgi:hypothetical protein
MNESDQSDGQLLAEFAATGSQAAFAENDSVEQVFGRVEPPARP